jgi:hypothetical protein
MTAISRRPRKAAASPERKRDGNLLLNGRKGVKNDSFSSAKQQISVQIWGRGDHTADFAVISRAA